MARCSSRPARSRRHLTPIPRRRPAPAGRRRAHVCHGHPRPPCRLKPPSHIRLRAIPRRALNPAISASSPATRSRASSAARRRLFDRTHYTCRPARPPLFARRHAARGAPAVQGLPAGLLAFPVDPRWAAAHDCGLHVARRHVGKQVVLAARALPTPHPQVPGVLPSGHCYRHAGSRRRGTRQWFPSAGQASGFRWRAQENKGRPAPSRRLDVGDRRGGTSSNCRRVSRG